jgi:poly-beta-1,6-N-acetyl-D-glucosamine N-deacetylase
VIRALIFAGLRLSGLPWLLREAVRRRRTTILVYHDPSPRTMEGHLRALGRRYNFVSLADYVSSRTGGLVQLPPKSLVITLDDGHAGNHELRGVFERFDVRPTIFVCTGLIGTRRGFWFLHAADVEALKRLPNDERIAALGASGFSSDAELPRREALSTDELRSLSTVADIQSHTVTHPILPACTNQEARFELEESKRQLEQSFDLAVDALAYPNGDYSDRELSLTRALGYTCAVTVDGGSNTSSTDLFRLRRTAVDDRDSVDAVLVKASGLWRHVKGLTGRPSHGYVRRP